MKYELEPCSNSDVDMIWEKDGEADEVLKITEENCEAETLVLKIADDGGNTVAGCVIGIDMLKNAEFERLWVDEAYRGRGFGKALIREAERAAFNKGCRVMINAYNFDFQITKPLFEKLGYRHVGTIKNWPKGCECYTLIKELDENKNDHAYFQRMQTADQRIELGNDSDKVWIVERLEEYNCLFAPRAHEYLDLDKSIKDDSGRLIAGVIAGVSGWETLHIDMIWVDAPYRKQGIGLYMIERVEDEAKLAGAYLSRLSVQDDSMEFFKKLGYAVAVTHDGKRKWYDMYKTL